MRQAYGDINKILAAIDQLQTTAGKPKISVSFVLLLLKEVFTFFLV